MVKLLCFFERLSPAGPYAFIAGTYICLFSLQYALFTTTFGYSIIEPFINNYEKKEDNILKAPIPYQVPTPNNVVHWDIRHYKTIRDNGYDNGGGRIVLTNHLGGLIGVSGILMLVFQGRWIWIVMLGVVGIFGHTYIYNMLLVDAWIVA